MPAVAISLNTLLSLAFWSLAVVLGIGIMLIKMGLLETRSQVMVWTLASIAPPFAGWLCLYLAARG